jgi:hypothetical protein
MSRYKFIKCFGNFFMCFFPRFEKCHFCLTSLAMSFEVYLLSDYSRLQGFTTQNLSGFIMATLCCHGLLQQLAVFIVVFTTKVLYYKTLQIRNSWEMGRFHCKLFSFLLSVTLVGLYEHTVLLRNLYITNL